jgi:hypothetical protein
MVNVVFTLLCLTADASYSQVPSMIDGLTWHKWANNEYVVLSLNKSQGEFVISNVGKVKKWALHRWGFPDVALSCECRLLCVYDQNLMNKLFSLDHSKIEWKEKEQLFVGWLLLNDSPAITLPEPITELSLLELSRQIGHPLDYWAMRGIIKLNNVSSVVKADLLALNDCIINVKKVYFVPTLFEMNFQKWNALNDSDKRLYDLECMVLCLMLRKEYGQTKFKQCIFSQSDIKDRLKTIYSFQSIEEFNSAYIIYMRKLCDDIARGQTPDSYLEILPYKE